MKNASYCVSYGKEGRLQQNEQKNSFCYSPFYVNQAVRPLDGPYEPLATKTPAG